MSLISCPECSRQVSTAASTCPGCGPPIAATETAGGSGVVTIQQTGKNLKFMRLVGIIMFLLSVPVFGYSDIPEPPLGIVLAFGGILLWITGRFLTWWRHS